MNAEGNVIASQLLATQGISAVGRGIWIGESNGTTYSSGISLGGGALSGAGVGGAQALTGDVDAILIGNNARATMPGSLSLGLDSSSIAIDAIATGHAASAKGEQDVIVGTLNTSGTGGNNTVIGNQIVVIGADSAENRVPGYGHRGMGSGSFVAGDPNSVAGSRNVATGSNVTVTVETVSETQAGVAIAMAMQNPALHAKENFGVALNWGTFEQSHALSLSGMGVVSRNVFGGGERLALTDGFGLGVQQSTLGGHSSDTKYGGRAGVQLTS